MIVDRIGLALLAIGAGGIACMMLPEAEEPDPLIAPSTCTSQTFEPDRDGMPDWMRAPEGHAIVEAKLAIEPMRGPFLTFGHACATCIANQATTVSAPFQASTIIGQHHSELAVQVGGLWYLRRIGDVTPGAVIPQLIDLAPMPGAELIVTMTNGAADTRVICGVGPSAIPSCAQIELGSGPLPGYERMSPELGTHLRLDTSCDGTAVIAGWRTRSGRCGDQIRVWVRERIKLAFP